MPLVINRLKSRHTHTNTHTYQSHGQKQFKETICDPACGWHAPSFKSSPSEYIHAYKICIHLRCV